MDEKSIENGLEGQKFLVVCLFWGGCHHPNCTVYFTIIQGQGNGGGCASTIFEFITDYVLLKEQVRRVLLYLAALLIRVTRKHLVR